MAERSEITTTLDATNFGSSLKDLEDGDLSRGYSSAGPGDAREDALQNEIHFRPQRDYGFVGRPIWRSDIERN